MRVEHVLSYEDKIKHGLCPHLPNGYLVCYAHHCDHCEIADRIRSSNAREAKDVPLFEKNNCLRQTPKGGGEIFYKRPVVLSENAMKKYGLKLKLFYQLAFAYDGGGCLPKNTAGPVDIYLFADDTIKLTVLRFELLGVPNEDALKRYDKIFFMGLHRKYK